MITPALSSLGEKVAIFIVAKPSFTEYDVSIFSHHLKVMNY